MIMENIEMTIKGVKYHQKNIERPMEEYRNTHRRIWKCLPENIEMIIEKYRNAYRKT